MILVPKPKFIEEFNGYFKLKNGYAYLGKGARKVKEFIKEFLHLELSAYDGEGTIAKFYVDPVQVQWEQGYILTVDKKGIKVVGHDEAGLFYGIMTLHQILKQSNGSIKYVRIKDHPDFPQRGVMLDISRDKIPKISTLKMIIDMLSKFKINHLELYMEHTFAYRKHRKVWEGYSPLTGEDIMELDDYSKERFVELVPNQNSFGHMEKWLIHDEYKHLAESPNGFITPWGERRNTPFSLSPAVPETIEFLESLYDELLPNFSSDKFNVGCDETFDLCQGKSKGLCEKYGKGRVYMDFILKIHSLVRKHGMTMLFWGDIIKNHPELIESLPDEIVVLIWGYEEDHAFDKECEIFSKYGIPFYVCPGTSTWNSILGRVDNALKNIENAVENGKRCGSVGVLNTDWGDNGHWQHLPFSFLEWIWGAALSWNVNGKIDIEKALNYFVFEDENEMMGRIMLNLGNVYKRFGLRTFNSSLLALPLIRPEIVSKEHGYFRKLREKDLEKIEEMIESASADLKKTNMKRLDAEIIKEEIENAINLSLHSIRLMKEIFKTDDGKIVSIPRNEREKLIDELKSIVEEYKKIWKTRNREGGLRFSVEKLTKIIKFYKQY